MNAEIQALTVTAVLYMQVGKLYSVIDIKV
jgi:hypothetical protein